jgi:hypothetical protein
MKRSEQIGELVAALAKAQAEFTPALKNSKNPYYNSKYADLSAVIGAVRPALNKHGVVLTQDISADLERQVVIVRTGLYFGEQFLEIEIEAPATGQSKKDEQSGVAGTKFDVQTIGAGTLYLRRYSVAAICGLAAEDDDEDDGNSLDNNNKPISKKVPCPNCGKDAIIKGREEYGGGWLCYKKNGGCGAKFTTDPATITRTEEEWNGSEPSLPSENISQPPVSPQTKTEAQPPTGKPEASPSDPQGRVGPTKRIPPTGSDKLPRLICTVKTIKEWPKDGKVNASINVKFEAALDGNYQGETWVRDHATCWHESLFEAIRASVGKECQFAIKEWDAKAVHYIDIEDVIEIDGVPYDLGKPSVDIETGEIIG